MVIHRSELTFCCLPFSDVAVIRDQLMNMLLAARDTVNPLPPAIAEGMLIDLRRHRHS